MSRFEVCLVPFERERERVVCVSSCPSPAPRNKRLAFELFWKWSMPYGQNRCVLTWFSFNTCPQEAHSKQVLFCYGSHLSQLNRILEEKSCVFFLMFFGRCIILSYPSIYSSDTGVWHIIRIPRHIKSFLVILFTHTIYIYICLVRIPTFDISKTCIFITTNVYYCYYAITIVALA